MSETINLHHRLVQNLKNGDHTAAFELYNAYSKSMYNTLIRISGDSEQAKDLLQEAFTKAFLAIHSFEGKATFGSWLKRIVVNTGLEHLRKNKVQFEEIEEDIFVEEEEPEQLEAEVIHQKIKELPNGCRTVFSLYLFEGFSHQQIAETLSISESTSKSQYLRAKKLLKHKLKEVYYEG